MKTQTLAASFLITLTSITTFAQTITSVLVDSGTGGKTGSGPSHAIVAGNPAMAYKNFSDGNLMFARNSAADGSGTWTVSTVDSFGSLGEGASLCVVDGKPAISYNGQGLKYARNSAADGSGTWTTTTIALNTTDRTSLAVVNGAPAISFTSGDLHLKFARNSAVDGSGAWTLATVDSPGTVGQYTSLASIAGYPGISYYDQTNGDLKFARNNAIDGTGTWSAYAVDTAGNVGLFTSLCEVSGRPAIAYSNTPTGDLKFAINSAADGSGTWSVVVVGVVGSGGLVPKSLAVINGTPGIAYGGGTSVKFARSSTSDGTGSWTTTTVRSGVSVNSVSLAAFNGTPIISSWESGSVYFAWGNSTGTSWTSIPVESLNGTGSIWYGGSIAVVGGAPAISFYHMGNADLKWARITNLPAEIAVEQPLGTDLTDGTASIAFGLVNAGASSSAFTFTIKNQGSADLTGLVITKNGTNSGDFIVDTTGMTTTVTGAGSTTFTVTFTPTDGGARTAAIHIASNDANENPFDINLTGTATAPEIQIEQPVGNILVDGSAFIDYGGVLPGTPVTRSFRIKNIGDATLTGIAATIDGTNSGDFVRTTTPATSLAPHATTTFVVRFTPSAVGTRDAMLHVASDDADESPFDINLTGEGLTATQDWLQTNFGDTSGTGDAAPTADPNNNGIPNIIEYALGGDPAGSTTGTEILPDAGINPTTHCMEFSLERYVDRNDITLTVQAADSLSGPWTNLARSVNGSAFTILPSGTDAMVTESGTGATRAVTVCDIYPATDPAHPRRFMQLEVSQ